MTVKNYPNIKNSKLAVGEMLAAKRHSLGLSISDMTKLIGCNYKTVCMFEQGGSLLGKYSDKMQSAYKLNKNECEFIDELKTHTKPKNIPLNLREAKKKGLDLIYIYVSDEYYELPLICSHSFSELAEKLGVYKSAVSKGIAKHLRGEGSLYRVTLAPICDDDYIEEKRLEYFYKGEFDKCLSLPEKKE